MSKHVIAPCWLAILAIGLLACGEVDAPRHDDLDEDRDSAPHVESGPVVAFLGDSLTAGLHLDDPMAEAFPAVLGRRLEKLGLPVRVVNSGVSGDTTAGGLARLAWLMKQEPDVVVVGLGANDGLRGVPVEAVRRQLDGILTGLRRAGAAVLLLGVRLPPNLDRAYVEPFEAIYPELAQEHEIPLVPFFLAGVGGVPELNFADGLHPTARGHERIADNVEAELARLVESVSFAREDAH